jgi:hypothetical protein
VYSNLNQRLLFGHINASVFLTSIIRK